MTNTQILWTWAEPPRATLVQASSGLRYNLCQSTGKTSISRTVIVICSSDFEDTSLFLNPLHFLQKLVLAYLWPLMCACPAMQLLRIQECGMKNKSLQGEVVSTLMPVGFEHCPPPAHLLLSDSPFSSAAID